MSSTELQKISKMMPLVWFCCINCINDNQIWLTFEPLFSENKYPEDNNGGIRKRCKGVRLENGAEILLTSAFVFTDITSDTKRHFHFRVVGCGLEDV